MTPLQQKIYTILHQNAGNRLTLELINGLTARLQSIVNEHVQAQEQAQQALKKEPENG